MGQSQSAGSRSPLLRPSLPECIQCVIEVRRLRRSVEADLAKCRPPTPSLIQGVTVNTGIFKQPVSGTVQLRTLNLDGDRQADLSVHGGPFKAVYGYPSEHYDFWRDELPGMELPWGMFGENFTTEGLFEADLHIGDRLQIGSAILVVRQPRMPCYKLAAKFQRDDIIDLFL